MARYRDIAADIKHRIAAGEFPVGEQLPAITALMEHYRVPGLNTIRQAQQLLVDDGLLETRQGIACSSYAPTRYRNPSTSSPNCAPPGRP